MKRHVLFILVFLLVSAAAARPGGQAGAAADLVLTLLPSLPSGQYVGTEIVWTAETNETDPVDFSLTVMPPDGPQRLMYDFMPGNTFAWTPIDDGPYIIMVTMRNLTTGELTTATAKFDISPRAALIPVVTPTSNPLLGLYSAPTCAAGEQMRVIFRSAAGGPVTIIPPQPCRVGYSMNFYIAGMRAQTTYFILNQRFAADGSYLGSSPLRLFTTGTLPFNLPARQVLNPADGQTSGAEDIILYFPGIIAPNWPGNVPFATDLAGRVIWYNGKIGDNWATIFRPTPTGTILMTVGDDLLRGKVWQEVDLAGNVVRQTSAYNLNKQLDALGYPPMGVFHHDSRRLPNGHTAVLVTTERLMTDVQGPGEVNILGDYVLVLDENLQLVWVWDSFAHMDVYRVAILGELCVQADPWCLPLDLGEVANDWLHINSIDYTSTDQNLILSVRNQDWVVKIDYQDGQGSGALVWRLGEEGDFTLLGADGIYWPWLTHPHDAGMISANSMVINDNGNTRCDLGGDCTSRGQVYVLDEVNMTATLAVNVDLGYYANGFGTAQRLSNGNYAFTSGTLSLIAPGQAVINELTPTGEETHAMWINTPLYRAYRAPDLYNYSPAVTLNSLK